MLKDSEIQSYLKVVLGLEDTSRLCEAISGWD